MKYNNKEELLEAISKGKSLIGADLSGINIFGIRLPRENFTKMNLSKAKLYKVNFYGTNLSESDLSETNFFEANLSGANLSKANLSETRLCGATLFTADLSGAKFSKTDLIGANLSRAKLDKPIVQVNLGVKDQLIFNFCSRELQIGCEIHSFDHWLENYKEIGRENKYTKEEIERFGKIIEGTIKLYD